MRNGAEFPAGAGHLERGQLIVDDANHRVAAASRAGRKRLPWYVIDGDPTAITVFAYRANILHGAGTSEAERLEAAIWMVEGGTVQHKAAALLGISQNKLSKALAERAGTRRASEAGLDMPEWDQIHGSLKVRLMQITTDEGFAAAAKLTYRAKLNQHEVYDLVSLLNESRSGTRQVAQVQRLGRLLLPRRPKNLLSQRAFVEHGAGCEGTALVAGTAAAITGRSSRADTGAALAPPAARVAPGPAAPRTPGNNDYGALAWRMVPVASPGPGVADGDLLGLSVWVRDQWLAGFGPATRRAYTTDIRDLFDFALALGAPALNLGRGQLDRYARHLLEERRLAPRTVARRLSAASSLFRWAVDEQLLAGNPMVRVRRPTITLTPPAVALELSDMGSLLAHAGWHSPRAEVLLTLLLLNALRVGEILGADADGLGVDRGHRTLRVRRKGGRNDQVPLASPTATAVDRYLQGRRAGPLLLSRTGRRLDRSNAARLLSKVAAAALPAEQAAVVHPHACRHLAITAALDLGATLRDVQDYAAHASSDQTRAYDDRRGSLDRNPTYLLAGALLPRQQ